MILSSKEHKEYLKWKKQNVSFRGMKETGKSNDFPLDPLLGDGLYTAALSNKAMARIYGDVFYTVNAIPKHPLKIRTLNDWQIWSQQNLIKPFCIANNCAFDKREFYKRTDIRTEMLKLGYDGVIIPGREIVNYTPPEDIKYFKIEDEVIKYYLSIS